MKKESIGLSVIQWAEREGAVLGLVMIGSRARGEPEDLEGSDIHSDWDFQIIVKRPDPDVCRRLACDFGHGKPLACVTRRGRLGSSIKTSLVFSDGELDLVVLSARKLNLVKWLLNFRIEQHFIDIRRGLTDLALVLRGGYKIIKGTDSWSRLFKSIVEYAPSGRLDDDGVHAISEGYLCDYISFYRKIDRGEFLAGQRWLHLYLVEANFRLLHELRLRRNMMSFPDARRIETLSDVPDVVTVKTAPDFKALSDAAERSSRCFRYLVGELIGSKWRWPQTEVCRRKKL